MTPHQYVIRCRIRRAMRLLARGELTLAEIALEVGCACQSHLTTLFRKHLGTTPGAFRESASEGEQPAGTGRDVARKAQLRKANQAKHTPSSDALKMHPIGAGRCTP